MVSATSRSFACPNSAVVVVVVVVDVDVAFPNMVFPPLLNTDGNEHKPCPLRLPSFAPPHAPTPSQRGSGPLRLMGYWSKAGIPLPPAQGSVSDGAAQG